jgi:hypothetical protein
VTPEVRLIAKPLVDFDGLLAIANQTLGFSPARGVDAARREFSESERFVSILDEIENESPVVGLSHEPWLWFAVLIIADADDMLAIARVSGMRFICRETIKPGIMFALFGGTLNQWRDAVIAGTAQGGNVRACYCKILAVFESLGLAETWAGYLKTPTSDRLFLLEHKR